MIRQYLQERHDGSSADLVESGTVLTLDIPQDSVPMKHGFSVDFGSSIVKIAYALEIEDKIRLHFVSYPRERLEEAFQHIKDKIGDKIEPGQEVYLTGVGTNTHKDVLETTLNIRMKNIFESDCFVDGFQFLVKNVPSQDLYYQPSEKVKNYDMTCSTTFMTNMKLIGGLSDRVNLSPTIERGTVEPMAEEDVFPDKVDYPALIAICGSVAVMILVQEDGSYEGLDNIPCCGRSLLACGSVVAGAMSFEELVTLAENGKAGNIDTYASDELIDTKSTDEAYSKFEMDDSTLIFSWGQGVGKNLGDFKREDWAAAAISMISLNLATWCQMWAGRMKTKHIYLFGSLVTNSQLVRDEIHKGFAHRASVDRDGMRSHAHFLKLGAYLGSLGCLLKNLGAKA